MAQPLLLSSPQHPESPVPLPPLPLGLVGVTVTVQSRVHAAPVQTTGTALDPRLRAAPVEVLLLISANPKAVGVASWGRGQAASRPRPPSASGLLPHPSNQPRPLPEPSGPLLPEAMGLSSSFHPALPTPALTCCVEQPGIVAGELDPLLTVLGSIGQGTDLLPGCIPILDSPEEWPLHAGTRHPSRPQPVMAHNCPCPVLWGRDEAELWLERSILYPPPYPPPAPLMQFRANKQGQKLHSSPALSLQHHRLAMRQLGWIRKLRSSCKAGLQTPECSLPTLSSFTPPPFNLTGSSPPFHPSLFPHTLPHFIVCCPSPLNQSHLPRISQYTTNGFRGPLPSGSMVKFPEVFPLSR